MLLARLLAPAVTAGSITLIDGYGRTHHLGRGAPSVTLRLHDPALHRDLVLRPRLVFGEAYMDGRLTVDDGHLYELLAILSSGTEVTGVLGWVAAWIEPIARRLHQTNPLTRARRNVAHHYDLSGDLYRLFLDADMQYSCAYFPTPDTGLDAAQEAKKRHIAAKLLLRPGHRVLDIGCGWGGMALTLARETGVQVLGITLSHEQLAVARQRAEEAGLQDRVRFDLCDYRTLTGRFDRIVSVGMFEHVGVPHYDAFFASLHDRLEDDGVALVHSIGRSDGPGSTNPWFRKYIFPGGYSPALSEVLPHVERNGLWTTDVEILRLHYAETLRHWRQRFREHWNQAAALYDERFCRMWDFYLAGAEIAFRYQGHMVFQIQVSRSLGAVPLTRDYMVDTERTLAVTPSATKAPPEQRRVAGE